MNATTQAAITAIKEALAVVPRTPSNIGHGHVFKRPDGMVYRCGGPSLCVECAKDAAQKRSKTIPFDREVATVILAERAADKVRIAELEAALATARADVLEEAAMAAEAFTVAQHIASDMRAGRFPEKSDPNTAIATAIRDLKGGGNEA